MDNNCSEEHVLEKVGDGSMGELPENSSPKLQETNDGLEKLEKEDKTVQTDKHDRDSNLTRTRRLLNKEWEKEEPLMEYIQRAHSTTLNIWISLLMIVILSSYNYVFDPDHSFFHWWSVKQQRKFKSTNSLSLLLVYAWTLNNDSKATQSH